MFTYPYQIIKRKLLTDVTELRELEWFTDQDSVKDENASLRAAPGVYIQFLPADITTFSGQKIQSTMTEFDAILLTETLLDDDKRIKKDNPQDHMILLDKIHRSLQGFSALISYLPEFSSLFGTKGDQRAFNSLSRISITPPHVPRKAMMKSVLRYRGLFFDHGAAKLYTTMAKPPLELTTEISLPHFPTFDGFFDESFD
jgi:hypothetical protein